jgi:hypothetical protein
MRGGKNNKTIKIKQLPTGSEIEAAQAINIK